jgi:hypothetical protein
MTITSQHEQIGTQQDSSESIDIHAIVGTKPELEDLITSAILSPDLTESELMVVQVAAEVGHLGQVSTECSTRAQESAERAERLRGLIDALQITLEQHELAAVVLGGASLKAGESAEDLIERAEIAGRLYDELAQLKQEEASLAKLIDDLERSAKSCEAALTGPINTMIGSAAYSGEQPQEAIESAAVELSKRDDSHPYEQTAAYNIDVERQRLELNKTRLYRLRERIAEKSQQLADHTDLAIGYADTERENGGQAISEAKDFIEHGLTALGNSLTVQGHDLLDDIVSDAVQASTKKVASKLE